MSNEQYIITDQRNQFVPVNFTGLGGDSESGSRERHLRYSAIDKVGAPNWERGCCLANSLSDSFSSGFNFAISFFKLL